MIIEIYISALSIRGRIPKPSTFEERRFQPPKFVQNFWCCESFYFFCHFGLAANTHAQIDVDMVVLLWYHDGKWVELETTVSVMAAEVPAWVASTGSVAALVLRSVLVSEPITQVASKLALLMWSIFVIGVLVLVVGVVVFRSVRSKPEQKSGCG